MKQTEEQFQQAVIQYAQLGGWRVYHTRMSKGSEPGFPDLFCVRAEFNSHGIVVDDSAEAVIAELKSSRNKKPTLDQQWWLAVLDSLCTNVRAYLWTPDDWPEINRVLVRRRRVTPAATRRSPALAEPRAVGDGGSSGRGVGAGAGDARACAARPGEGT